MSNPGGSDRDPKDLGSRSPVSEEAKEQNAAGQRGGPRAPKEQPEKQKQPPQTSGRRGAQHEQPPQERRSFEPGQAPSEQGEGSPKPGTVAKEQGQQGVKRQSGSHSAKGERTEEEAQKGEGG